MLYRIESQSSPAFLLRAIIETLGVGEVEYFLAEGTLVMQITSSTISNDPATNADHRKVCGVIAVVSKKGSNGKIKKAIKPTDPIKARHP